ncbi:MAG: ABC transporter substrate-binding protein, partial [Verrucomicrobiota bacterium]
MSRPLLLLAALLLSFQPGHSEEFPGADWVETPSPLASEFAEPGGKISMFASQYPQSFNYLIHNNLFAREFFRMMFMRLVDADPVTLELVPSLANRWTVGEDKKTFTFHLDERAVWSDGVPITSDDVIWTYEALTNPDHLTGSFQVLLSRITSCEAIDERTVV